MSDPPSTLGFVQHGKPDAALDSSETAAGDLDRGVPGRFGTDVAVLGRHSGQRIAFAEDGGRNIWNFTMEWSGVSG